ncbi:MAG TPA: pyridoxal phosphate-dependent aminotransferase [Candidatus Saccharimonadales bacterium]|nr:pyridoxal phosphate-dependent aminotransferase [Candidatus Saccharimonadales bacterium]
MRLNVVHPGADELKYEIRGIVRFANKLEETGIDIIWENIGDPVAKGEEVPQWIRDIIAKEAEKSSESYGYSPTKGLLSARKFLARTRSAETGAKLTPENIIFFNGLGDAVTKIYTWLNPMARVLGPNPAYPTHSSLEGAHSHKPMLTYDLDPDKGWLPDPKEVRRLVKEDPSIAGLLIINPDNPTGVVYPEEILKEFVSIAKRYKLFLISDEIYANLAFENSGFVSLASLSKNVPTLIMQGLSKEVPWPGSRCGWIEFYNTRTDTNFSAYARSIEDAKMTEVCSTTLPQAVLPDILGHPKYGPHLQERRAKYEARAEKAIEILSASKHLKVVKPKGAFYLAVTFSDELKKGRPKLRAKNWKAQLLLESELRKIKTTDFDKRFCYKLLAATGICTVPLASGFNSHEPGFRMTLLENDEEKFEKTLRTILQAVESVKIG